MADIDSTMETNALIGFNALGILKQVGLMIGLAASVAIGVTLVLWAQGKDYRPLYNDIAQIDLMAATQLLDESNIAYKVDSAQGILMVDSKKINDARLKLAASGLPQNSGVGFNLLENQPIGSSQFMESARYKRSLEGELAKTIASISAVRNARVHLAIPKQSAFIRDKQSPSASVFIQRSGGLQLDSEQVRAIENLVAASIPQMHVDNVTVIDQNGSLLSAGSDSNDDVSLASKQLGHTRTVEKTLLNRINNIVIPIAGAGNFKAEVSADIDFSVIEQADEMFNPDLPSVRSEESTFETNGGINDASGIPGALSNQPPDIGSTSETITPKTVQDPEMSANSASRSQSVKNYELDRTLSFTRHQTGVVKRLTVAVVVDDIQSFNKDGKALSSPWTASELERLAILVRDAVGFSAARGDSVNIVNSPFHKPEAITMPVEPLWQQAWVLSLVKPIMSSIVMLALILGVLRPILKRLSEVPPRVAEPLGLELDGATGTSTAGMMQAGSDSLMLPEPGAGYDEQLTAVKGLIAEDSGRVAQVVKQWVAEEDS